MFDIVREMCFFRCGIRRAGLRDGIRLFGAENMGVTKDEEAAAEAIDEQGAVESDNSTLADGHMTPQRSTICQYTSIAPKGSTGQISLTSPES